MPLKILIKLLRVFNAGIACNRPARNAAASAAQAAKGAPAVGLRGGLLKNSETLKCMRNGVKMYENNLSM